MNPTTFHHYLTVSPESLNRLVSTLDNFSNIDPILKPLEGSGGACGPSLVTDGTDIVLLNPEGYNYPRYRSPRIAIELLLEVKPWHLSSLLVRKETFKPNFRITENEDLIKVSTWQRHEQRKVK